jgi:pantoate--beta-alanine ligase
MGALHAGHVSLIERAARDNEIVAVTIFVNPLQFGAGEDLASYPRDPERDLRLAAAAGGTHVFAPAVEEMYPEPVRTTVTVSGVGESMEAASRPTHFAGVATVVAKLFAISGPCQAYFGEKDFQQLAVVRRMSADLSFPVDVVGCPTVREHDGLALSSRNVYLTPAQRAAAPVLQRALRAGAAAVAAGERRAAVVRKAIAELVEAEPLVELDYAEVVDAATLDRLDPLVGDVRLLVAARLGRTRLIDNVGVLAG